MKIDKINTLWQIPRLMSYVQPPLTDELLHEAEKTLGYKIPATYIKLLRMQNGGLIRFTLPGVDVEHKQLYGIGPAFPTLKYPDWEDYGDWIDFPTDGLIPFDGDGHWAICLDYRKDQAEPEITLIDIEKRNPVQKKIAASFDEYLDLLELKPDEQYVIATGQNIEQTISDMQRLLGIEFQLQNGYSYTHYRARSNGELVWITPNSVPRTFIKKDDKRYEALKAEMEEYALRYPELPAAALLMKVTAIHVKDEALALFNTLTNCSFPIKPLQTYLP